jgi:hypothetical protein
MITKNDFSRNFDYHIKSTFRIGFISVLTLK